MSDSESDDPYRQRICCKGCETVPCNTCEIQLCPTSGHRESFRSDDGYDYCWKCFRVKESEEENEKLREENEKLREENEKLQKKLQLLETRP